MKYQVLLVEFLVFLAAPGTWSRGWADQVFWDVVASGGIVGSNSGSYIMSGSVGQTGIVLAGGAAYRIYSGFWTPWLIDQVEVEKIEWQNLPKTYQLSQNYPNPFNNQTAIHYAVPSMSRVTVEIYDLVGHRVRLLTDTAHQPGYYLTRWDGKDGSGRFAGSGIYLCRMSVRASEGSGFSQTKQVLLLR